MSSRALTGAVAAGVGLFAGVLLLLVFRTGADAETPQGIFQAMGRFGFAAGVVCLGSLAGAFVAFGERLRGEGERAVAIVCSVVAIISLAMMLTLFTLALIGPGTPPADHERRSLRQ